MFSKLVSRVAGFFAEDDGVTAIEYGLLAALIALAIVVGATAVGGGLDNMFNNIASRLSSV